MSGIVIEGKKVIVDHPRLVLVGFEFFGTEGGDLVPQARILEYR